MVLKNDTKTKIISLFLVILIITNLFCFPVLAVDMKVFEGLIIKNTEQMQFLSLSGEFHDITTENEDIQAFLDIVANSGVKSVISTQNTPDNKLEILGLTVAKQLPTKIQNQWDEYQKSKYGVYSELDGRVVSNTDGTYSFITNDKILTPLKFEFKDVEEYVKIVADSGVLVSVESAVYNDNSILVSYISSKEKLPDERLKLWQDYLANQKKENTKTGVIVSYGIDTYMLVEKDTNKMYYLTTELDRIYVLVPLLADRGYTVDLVTTPQAENVLNVTGFETDELPEEVFEELVAADKKLYESTFYYIEGRISLDGTDYNMIFEDGSKLGIQTNVSDVAKAIKCIADDEVIKVKLEGFINYEQTVMDVRRITFLEDVPEGETLNKLKEAFPEKEETSENSNQSPTFSSSNTVSGTNSNNTGNTPTENNTTTNNNLNPNNAVTNNNPNINANTNTNANMFADFNNFFNNSSSFAELYNSMFGNSQNTPNFGSLFGGDTSFTNSQDLFNSFNTQTQTQSSMLNSSNLSNFNFEEFQSAFDSLSANMNTNN